MSNIFIGSYVDFWSYEICELKILDSRRAPCTHCVRNITKISITKVSHTQPARVVKLIRISSILSPRVKPILQILTNREYIHSIELIRFSKTLSIRIILIFYTTINIYIHTIIGNALFENESSTANLPFNLYVRILKSGRLLFYPSFLISWL